jgi:nicotinate-nucleotide adenylyltransferase
MPPRIGIFGGTFDPPHRGHQALARAARRQLGLDRLLWVLTPDPPHKQGLSITPLPERLGMLRLALHGHPAYEISTVEMERPGPHFALDTVRAVGRQNPGVGLVYLMGGDSLQNLPNWHRPTELVAHLDALGVLRRPGDSLDMEGLEQAIPGLRAKVRWVEVPPVDVSGREIRARAASGRSFRRFLQAGVYRYIVENHLYRSIQMAERNG